MTSPVQRAQRPGRTVPVTLLTDDHRPALDAFLDAHAESTVFHRPEWADVMRATYGHETRYWVATDGDAVTGAFPVTVMHVPGLGRKYVAMPYQMHSGMPIGVDAAVVSALANACVEEARRGRAKYVEIRHFEAAPALEAAGFMAVESGLVTTTIPLTNLDLSNAEHGHRQRVRKAAKLNVEVVRSASIDDLRTFRRMYLETGRYMGAPQAGWRYFANMQRLMPSALALYLARHEERIVGGFLVLGDSHIAFGRCAAHSTREALSLNAGQALWWQAMNDAAAAGCPSFNCGISWTGDAGLIKWKEGWGGTSRPVRTYVLPLRSKPPDAGGYFEGFGLAKAVWKRLPLPVVDIVGHHVTRWIG